MPADFGRRLATEKISEENTQTDEVLDFVFDDARMKAIGQRADGCAKATVNIHAWPV